MWRNQQTLSPSSQLIWLFFDLMNPMQNRAQYHQPKYGKQTNYVHVHRLYKAGLGNSSNLQFYNLTMQMLFSQKHRLSPKHKFSWSFITAMLFYYIFTTTTSFYNLRVCHQIIQQLKNQHQTTSQEDMQNKIFRKCKLIIYLNFNNFK